MSAFLKADSLFVISRWGVSVRRSLFAESFPPLEGGVAGGETGEAGSFHGFVSGAFILRSRFEEVLILLFGVVFVAFVVVVINVEGEAGS